MNNDIFNIISGIHKKSAWNETGQENYKGHLWQVEITNTQTSNDKIIEVSKIFNMSSYHISYLNIYVGNYFIRFLLELNPNQEDSSTCNRTCAPYGG